MITPAAPDCFNIPSSTLSEFTTVQRSLVAQQSTSEILCFPPRPAHISFETMSFSEPLFSEPFAALAAFTSAFV